MPHVLEIKGGELLTPLKVFDVLEAVEDYMGTDISVSIWRSIWKMHRAMQRKSRTMKLQTTISRSS